MATFSPELLKNIKKNLGSNLGVIKSLIPGHGAVDDNRGVKLVFNLTTGKFSTEKDGFNRTMGNLFKSGGSDSATNKNCFEYPLLITFYEIKKIQLKIRDSKNGPRRDKNYELRLGNRFNNNATNGYNVHINDPELVLYASLEYLRDNTYNAANKVPQKTAINQILAKAHILDTAHSVPQLDNLMAGNIPFGLPEDIKTMIARLFSNDHILRLDRYYKLNNSLVKPRIGMMGDYIYEHIYDATNLINLAKKPLLKGSNTSSKSIKNPQGAFINEKDPNLQHKLLRCELFAKGLINAAAINDRLTGVDRSICEKNLALVFSNAGVEYMNNLPIMRLPPP